MNIITANTKAPGETVDRTRGEPGESAFPKSAPVYHRVLLGADFSAASGVLFEHALAIARANHAELIVAHADVPPSAVCYMPAENYDQWLTAMRRAARDKIRAHIESARQAGVRCHAVALTGMPAEVVIEAARKLRADLVVIGSPKRGRLSHLMWGDATARIVKRAPCAVLVVPCEPAGH